MITLIADTNAGKLWWFSFRSLNDEMYGKWSEEVKRRHDVKKTNETITFFTQQEMLAREFVPYFQRQMTQYIGKLFSLKTIYFNLLLITFVNYIRWPNI